MKDADDWNRPIIEEFRATGGSVDSRGFGRDLVLVHHVGARTARTRVSPAVALRDGPDVWVISASAGGSPRNPGWYYNLLAHPDTVIETPDEGTVAVRAVDLTGPERDEMWARFVSASAGFGYYETRTSRRIPVLALHRR